MKSGPMPTSAPMAVDDLILLLGNPGRYQILLCFLFSLDNLLTAFNQLCTVFYAANPYSFQCNAPRSHWVYDYDHAGKMKLNPCLVYINKNVTNLTTSCTSGWSYIYYDRESTIIEKWDLVCERKTMVQLAASTYFVGAMIGGFFFGTLSDNFGRKTIALITLWSTLPIGIGVALIPNFYVFLLFRALIGFTIQGLQASSYVMSYELFPPARRTIAGSIKRGFYSVGIVVMAGVAYLIQDWSYIQLATTLPIVFTFSYYWVLPESLRWLLSMKKYNKAKNVIKRYTRINRIELPEGLIDNLENIVDKRPKSRYTLIDLFKTPIIRKHALIMFFVCLVVSWSYYSHSLVIPKLVANKYLNVAIGGFVEIPSYIAVYFVMKRFGRKRPLMIYFVVAAIGCLIAAFIPKKTASGKDIIWVRTVIALIARAVIAGTYTLSYTLSSELFPTVMRNVGFGACLFWTRAGGVIAPQFLILGQLTHDWIPMFIAGVVCIMASLLISLVPDTSKTPLPDTVEEAERMGKEIPKIYSPSSKREKYIDCKYDINLPLEFVENNPSGLKNC